jgi:hypothetical protein
MKLMLVAAHCAALFSCDVAFAQAAPATAAPAIVPTTTAPIVAIARPTLESGAGLPANTEVWFAPNAEVNSKRIKQGEKFDMTVTRDVTLGDYVVIPRGTKGIGQVGYRTGKGAFGKSAKMEFDIVDIELGGSLIPVTGHYRIEGQGNTGATVGAVVAVGVFSAFVTGHSAVVAQGTEYKAFTTGRLPVALPAAPVAPVASVAPAPAAAVPAATVADPVKSVVAKPTGT